MGQKIYVVKRAEGEYEDYYEYIEKAFYEQDKADKYITDKTAIFKRLESYRAEWEIIEAELEKAVSEEYLNAIENISFIEDNLYKQSLINLCNLLLV